MEADTGGLLEIIGRSQRLEDEGKLSDSVNLCIGEIKET